MARALLKVREDRPVASAPGAVRLGTLVGIDAEGRPLVVVGDPAPGGRGAAPLVARVGIPGPPPSAAEIREGVQVVLAFDADDARPVITGVVRASFEAPAAPAEAPGAQQTRTMSLNGDAVIVEGQDEIVLRCGLGSLTIRADGQIVVKGTRLVSRASETNKIRGASVQIN